MTMMMFIYHILQPYHFNSWIIIIFSSYLEQFDLIISCMNRRQGGVQVCMSFKKTNKQAKPKQLFAEKKEREFVIFIVHTYIYFFISFLVMTTHDFNIFFH